MSTRFARFRSAAPAVAATLSLLALGPRGGPGLGAQQLTPPEAFFGHQIGADYQLPDYDQFSEYWHKLAWESPRMVLEEIGWTAEGRPQLMAIITRPENHDRLEEYRQISRQLALGQEMDEASARALAAEGRAVVWIDGGLHASEVLGAQQLLETTWQLVSADDEETLRVLEDVIVLLVHANPDGHQLLADWYMREEDPLKRTTGGIPRLYHKYVGHDNNRDSYLVSQPETESMARVLYIDWMPQIMYNHHQVGPAGAIMWAPPFRYPANYNIDPLVLAGIEEVGMAMQSRFVFEGKPGVTMREGGPFSTWWNGGLRTTAYFHNIIGLLTETQGNPTPIEIPFVPSRTLPDGDYFMPIEPQTWHFRQSIDYEVTANRAVLDYASRNRERLQLNIWRAARNQIEAGSRDHWTVTPRKMARLQEILERNDAEERFVGPQTGALAGYFSLGSPVEYFQELRRPEDRDPRGYILPSDQPDFPTATKFVNALIKNGVEVLRATEPFAVGGREYPAGSWVVKTAQAYRPHVLDMFEPQDHPDDFAYEGGPPIPPYDNAGYTLAYQMGVAFDRILDGFEGPFEPVEGLASPPPGRLIGPEDAPGFVVSHAVNDATILTNRLLREGLVVNWLTGPMEVTAPGRSPAAGVGRPGDLFIPNAPGVVEKLRRWLPELGIDAYGVDAAPTHDVLVLGQPRIGLWDQYGGSMPSGWTRWILERFEFPVEVVYPQRLDAGELRKQYDVLIFPTGAIPESDGPGGGFAIFGRGPDEDRIPEEYRERLGRITVASTVPHLEEFLQAGGTIIAVGSSTVLARHLGLPVGDHLVDGDGRHLGPEQYYVPGSVLRARVDNTLPLAYGVPEQVDVFFNNAPVMRLQPAAVAAGVRPVAWFDSAEPLRSGWAWGQHRLKGGVAAAQVSVGQGHLYLFGPEITKRGQPHGTFKFLFNGLYLSAAEMTSGGARR